MFSLSFAQSHQGHDGGMTVWVGAAVGLGVAAVAYSYMSGAPSKKKKNKKAAEVARPTGPKVNVYFGSQTGTAEEFAKALSKEGAKRGFDMRAVDLDQYEPHELPGSNAVFLVATYGEGDPTDNSKAFHQWLVEDASEGALEGMKFAVFGLGNTQYEHYNTMGKTVDAKCEKLGGERLLDLGLGDDDKNIQEDFDGWKERLWPALEARFGLEASGDVADEGVEYRLRMRTFSSEVAARAAGASPSGNTLDAHEHVRMGVKANRELYKGGGRSCRHVELDIHGTGAEYVTGDHVGIMPENDPEVVEELAKRLNADLDTWVSLEDESGAAPFPCPCTLREAFTRYLDLNHSVKRTFAAAMAERATDEGERARLTKLASKEGREELGEHVTKGRRTALDLLREFGSVELGVAEVLELTPRLQPRYYSISSASVTSPVTVHVTAVILREDMPDGRVFKGLCTNYIYALDVGQKVTGFCRRTTFKLPPSPSTPVIMVGAGTGLAPLRGMYLHLEHLRASGAELGHNVLVFGCRTPCDDYLYQEEIEEMVKKGTVRTLHTAFSRAVPGQRVYVQDRVREHAESLLALLDSGAFFYVCGLTAMAKDVKKALTQGLVELRGVSGGEAEAYLERLHAEGRYMQDVWSS